MSIYTEKDKMRYINKRKSGLCPRCSKPLDRQGYYCMKCLTKVNQYGAENREFYRSIGICPNCSKNKLYGNEKTCIECVAKASEYEAKTREKDIEAYNRRHRNYWRKKQTIIKEQGLCTRCGKNKPANGRKMCLKCLNYVAKWRKSKGVGQRTEDRYERVARGLCWYCDNPAEVGYKTCVEHHSEASSWAIKSQEVRKAKKHEQTGTNN